MAENGEFNIYSTEKATNKNITVLFSPSENVTSYKYQVYKDNVIIDEKEAILDTEINLTDTGEYYIVVTLNLNDGSVDTLQSGNYVIDKEKPVIEIKNDYIELKAGETFNVFDNVKATDNYGGDITGRVTTNSSILDFNTAGEKELVYTVIDEAGNITQMPIRLNILAPSNHLLALQMIIIVCLIIIMVLISRFGKAMRLEKRIQSFVIEPLSNHEPTFFDKMFGYYRKLVNVISKTLKKSVFCQKYAKKLEKYTVVTNTHNDGFDIISGKIIIAVIFGLVAVVSKALQLKIISLEEIVLVLLLGFFVFDIFLFAKYKVFRWQVESDFIAAITIMNNAFKSGRSIIQAIDNVSMELKGVIGKEFNKMSLELLYGLAIDDVFRRFAKRIDLEEANYLTASLTILNKTGGNITEVFSSIEKSLFDKRKLRLELKSLTSGSKLVVGVLMGIPFLFVLVVSLINPEYFMPFITTDIGRILLIFMIIYYIIFVVFIRKVMKVVI